MATLLQIISTVADMRKAWRRSDDDSLTDRQLAFIINYYRAKLLEQEANLGRRMNSNVIQNLGKVSLIKADKNECCEIDNCILRIENPLPKALDTNRYDLVTYVGLLNGNKSFQRTDVNKVPYDKYATYTSNQPKWYQVSDYIYIVNPPTHLLKYINIKGVFEDPTAAQLYRTCSCPGNDEADCWKGFDYEYPISITMLDTIYKMMFDAEFKFGNILAQDTTNDTKDDQ